MRIILIPSRQTTLPASALHPMLRTILFWTHLTAGVSAGAVIVMMSVTGVILTYERQLVEWAEATLTVDPPAGEARLTTSRLLDRARLEGSGTFGDFDPATLTVRPDPGAVVQVAGGASARLYLDPWSGDVLSTGFPRLEAFLDAARGWHRWFNVEVGARRLGRGFTGAANLVFLFILTSGLILWIPRKRTWRQFKQVLAYRRSLSGRARDFNWHNVTGIWVALPLMVVAGSATVISYAWASDLLTRVADATAPSRGPAAAAPTGPPQGPPPGAIDLDGLLGVVGRAAEGWREIVVTLPDPDDPTVTMQVYRGYRGQPQLHETWEVDAGSGAVLERTTFDDLPRSRRFRSVLRFVHTGEYWGLPGQTVAGLVSLGAVFLGLTGISLALRRWAAFRRRRSTSREGPSRGGRPPGGRRSE